MSARTYFTSERPGHKSLPTIRPFLGTRAVRLEIRRALVQTLLVCVHVRKTASLQTCTSVLTIAVRVWSRTKHIEAHVRYTSNHRHCCDLQQGLCKGTQDSWPRFKLVAQAPACRFLNGPCYIRSLSKPIPSYAVSESAG